MLPTASLGAWIAGVLSVMMVASYFDQQADDAFWPGLQGLMKQSYHEHLGGEYWHIAQAVASGRGFSDPFPIPTGPTAWMPPMLVYIQAALIGMLGDERGAVALAVIVLKSIVIGSICWFICNQGTACGHPWLAILSVALVIGGQFYWIFQTLHDAWLVSAFMSITLVALIHCRRRPTVRQSLAWGAFGGLFSLASPVGGLTWAVATTGFSIRHPRTIIIAAATALLVVSPWTIRCAVTLGEFVPIKSNGGYELWISNVADDDGRLDMTTIERHHPYASSGTDIGPMRVSGETTITKRKGAEAFAWIRAHPRDFSANVLRRFSSATIWYTPFDPRDARQEVKLYLKRFAHCLPVLALLYGLWRRSIRQTREFQVAAVLFVIYLAPYVLISYYERYGVPLLAVKMMLVFLALTGRSRRLEAVNHGVLQAAAK